MSQTATVARGKRFALVGTGGRAAMYVDAIVQEHRNYHELVGLCDTNRGRIEYYQRRVCEAGYDDVPGFEAEQFDQMVQQTRPDVVIVTTVDAFHHLYIIRAMELGCDVITEKPLTIGDDECRAICDAVQRTGRDIRVAFNFRWAPAPTKAKELLLSGVIGEVLHVGMEYLLDTSHGADYFRRWHREKDKSGGLLVHKGTHHFDLINWLIDAVPETVFGFGRLAFYGKQNALKRGDKVTYERYTGSADAQSDPFALDLTDGEGTRQLYYETEKYDGYRRDRNVFGDGISIEDAMSVLVKYRTGVVLNYSLNAYLPREGYHVAFNGSKGRLELTEHHNTHIVENKIEAIPTGPVDWETSIVVHPMFGRAYKVPIPKVEGGHLGADPLIAAQMFSPEPPEERLGRNAGHGQGAASILIGVAANKSFEVGEPIRIADLCPQLGDVTRLSELP